MRTIVLTLLLSLQLLAGGKESTIPVAMEGKDVSGSGTGVCIAQKDGHSLILTNKHVLKDATRCWGIVDSKLVKGKVVFVNDGVDDLAAMDIEALVPLVTIASADPVIGTKVTHYGRMSGPMKGTMKGAMEFTFGNGDKVTELLSDTVSIPGDSGAGMFDKDDTLIGLNTGRLGPIDTGLQMGVPATAIRVVVKAKVPGDWGIK